MFRCPTCIAVLVEPRARRCETCGQNLRRRQPLVLGEAARVSSRHLPIDRVLADNAARDLMTWQQPAPTSVVAPRIMTAPVSVPAPAPERVLTPAAASAPAPAPAPAEPLIVPLIARATHAAATAPILDPEPIVEPEPLRLVEAIVVVEPEPEIEIVVEPEPVLEPMPMPEPVLEVVPDLVDLVEHDETSDDELAALEAIAQPAPHVELFDQFAAELAEGVDDEPIVVEQPAPLSPLEAMLASFVEAPHEVPMRRHMDPLPKPEASTTTPPDDNGQILLAVGGEPVRYVDSEMEDALDMLARAAREEILAANAPEAEPAVEPVRKLEGGESPWLAPIRKAWEPPADDGPDGKRWSFRRK